MSIINFLRKNWQMIARSYKKNVLIQTNLTYIRKWPININNEDVTFFSDKQRPELKEISLLSFSDVNIISDGTLFKYFKAYKELMLETDQEYLGWHNTKGLIALYLKWKKIRLATNQKYLLIHNIYSSTYYHWLVEALPRLFLSKDWIKQSVLLLPASHNQHFHQESLNLFGINNIHVIEKYEVYKVKHLISPTHPGKMANYHPSVIQKTANYISAKVRSDLQLGIKIYISRAKANRRKVLNENEVVVYLESKGFTTLCFEDYSFTQQVSIMKHCRYFISIHGAALTNMIFMPKRGKVLELRKFDKGHNYFFYSLACTCELDYYYQFCRTENEDQSVQEADIYVNMDLFRKNVELMLA